MASRGHRGPPYAAALERTSRPQLVARYSPLGTAAALGSRPAVVELRAARRSLMHETHPGPHGAAMSKADVQGQHGHR